MDPSMEQNPETKVPDWILAKQGIQLLINNKADEAENLFKNHPDSLILFAGYSFTTFIDALMTFEEDKLNHATAVLKEVEKKCTASDTGWLRSVRKVFAASDAQPSLAEHLETQVILADSLVCLAVLTVLQQDLGGYFKGSWALRKAWKIYQHSYHQILALYKEAVADEPLPPEEPVDDHDSGAPSAKSSESDLAPPSPPNGYPKLPYSRSTTLLLPKNSPNSRFSFLKKSFSVSSALAGHSTPNWGAFASSLSIFTQLFTSADKLKAGDVDKATVQRLMAAVSFGYGLFQLGISLLPPSLLKLTNFLGFGGNRQGGIACLMYARNGIDMRAPLATLALLWYHTIVRPFYALDGSNVQAGVNAATSLLQEAELDHKESALFLFFKGRIHRLNSDIGAALGCFQLSVDNATQREIKILSMHEVGWCYLIMLDYCNAEQTFSYLKTWSRWSRAFYVYLAGICTGSCAKSSSFSNIKDIQNGVESKGNQLEEFLMRRAKCCIFDDTNMANVSPIYWRLLVYEMLYLWNALPSCSHEDIAKIRLDCEEVERSGLVEPMVGLSKLILGCCWCIEQDYGRAVHHFREALSERKELGANGENAHVSAFSQYELGALLSKQLHSRSEGKALLQQIGQYKDYDFEQRLNVRVYSILKHL